MTAGRSKSRGGGGMLGLALATVRARRTAFAGSFAALCLGVAVLTMSALILLSGDGGVPGRYAGAPVLVRSAQGGTGPDGVFLERAPWSAHRTKELTRALDALPGVRRAVPDRSFSAQAVSGGAPVGRQRAGDRLGHGWSAAALAPYRLTAGRAPQRADEVALDRALGARPGERITLLTAAGAGRFTVSGTVDGPGYYLTDEQVLWTVAAETAFVVALGSVLGALTALPSLLGLRVGLSGTLGVPVRLVVPVTPVAAAVAGCLVLALAASVLPARAALAKAARVGAG
ncbi:MULTISPECIES: hypothetical protein [unclassified Streptomyces]|uniref:hypothetical protein n=1 Tax=unclassified Streptomyces TaxID=2593676 RepID=UPI0033E54CFC